MLTEGLLQVAITVRDLDAATAFYRDTLGMTFLFRSGPMSFLQCGDTRILLGTENASSNGVLLYFRVADVEETAARLVERGVALVEKPRVVAKLADRDVWLASFQAGDGTVHHLMAERPAADAARA